MTVLPPAPNWDAPTLVYVVENASLSCIKVGIGNRRRIARHEALGWTLTAQWSFADRWGAVEVEAAVLEYWRDELNLPVGASEVDMPQAGWTETAPLGSMSTPGVVEFVDGLIDE